MSELQSAADGPRPNHCMALVWEPPHYLHSHRCERKNGHGLYGAFCKQHAKQAERRAVMARDFMEWKHD